MMSQRAPGARFQYHVPPTPSAHSSTKTESPCLRSRCSRYSPAKPAPTTTSSVDVIVDLLLVSIMGALLRAIAGGVLRWHSRPGTCIPGAAPARQLFEVFQRSSPSKNNEELRPR